MWSINDRWKFFSSCSMSKSSNFFKVILCVCVCVYVCVCVRKRERERERENAIAYACVCSDRLIVWSNEGSPYGLRRIVRNVVPGYLLYVPCHSLIISYYNLKTTLLTKFWQRKNRLRIKSGIWHFKDNIFILNHPVYIHTLIMYLLFQTDIKVILCRYSE